MRQIEGQPRSLITKAKDLPRKIGHAIGHKFSTINPLSSSPELAAEAAGNLVNVGIEDPKTANTLEATFRGTAPTTVRGHAPTRSEAKADDEGKKDGKKSHLLRNVALGVTGVGLAGSAGLAAQHHIEYSEPLNLQAVERDVVSVPGGWWNLGKNAKDDIFDRLGIRTVPDTFNNSSEDVGVQAGVNAVSISPDQSLTFFDVEVKSSNTPPGEIPRVNLPFPLKLGKDDRIQISKEIVDQAFNPITQKPETMEFGREITVNRAGTEMALNIKEAEIFQIAPAKMDNREYFAGLVCRFKGNDGFQYELVIQDRIDLRQLKPSDAVKDAPSLGDNGTYVYGYKDQEKTDKTGIIIKGGETIITTAATNAEITMELRRIDPVSGTSVRVPIDFNLNSSNNLLYAPAQPPANANSGK